MNEVMNIYSNLLTSAEDNVMDIRKKKPDYEKLAESFDRIKDIVDVAFITTEHKMFVILKPLTPKDKKSFAYAVERINEKIKEYPVIRVNPQEYVAEWEDNKIQLYCLGAIDCKTIETKEMKEVVTIKPHPSCVAALSALEH